MLAAALQAEVAAYLDQDPWTRFGAEDLCGSSVPALI
jgi:hypothetical protein